MILISLVFAVIGIGISFTNTSYVSSEKILLSSSEDNLIDTYKELIKSSTILEKVVTNMNLNISTQELSNSINVKTIDHTNMIEINVSGNDSEKVKSISNEISKVFREKVSEIYGNNSLYDVDISVKHHVPIGITILLAMIMAIVGGIISILFFILCVWLDTKIKNCKDIEKVTGLRTLISIPKINAIIKKEFNITDIKTHEIDIFKTLMTNIQFLNVNNLQSKSIVITSSVASEGKTYVASNLAIQFAKAGKKVILIDGDMRKGKIDKIFNLPNDLGFSNYLSNLDDNGNVIKERITRFIKDTEIKYLNVITAGNIPPNPIELLKTSKVKQLIKDLKVFYDIIIFDTVSVLEAHEAEILSKNCDLTLLMSAYGKTKKEKLRESYETIKNKEGSVVGIGLNKVPEKRMVKQLNLIKNNLAKRLCKIAKDTKLFLISTVLFVGKSLNVFYNFIKSRIIKILEWISILNRNIKNKSQSVKKHIREYKNKREKIKLIEAGAISQEEKIEDLQQNNIIKKVFEKEMTQLESNKNTEKDSDDKISAIKTEIKENSSESEILKKEENTKKEIKKENTVLKEPKDKMEVRISKQEFPKKEKKENDTTLPKPNQNTEIKNEKEELILRQKLERERKEQEKKIKEEKIKNYKEIDFSKQEVITEEMIRQQVEMDDLIRASEIEAEEEKNHLQKLKLDAKTQRKKERKERFNKFKTEKVDILKNIIDTFAKKQEKQEEKRLRKKEEIRIEEEIQEDNLYPKPRM